MNNALSMLALGQMQAAKDSIKFDSNYSIELPSSSIELPNGEVVTLEKLMEFWIEGHRRIEKALEIIKESKEVEREPKEKAKLQSKQEVERLQTQDECETKGIGPDNTKEIVQGGKPTSQEPKRRRIRKSDK